jgi:hypothetical protein
VMKKTPILATRLEWPSTHQCTVQKIPWWLINLYMFFANCVKGTTQIWNLIIVRKFNEGIARTVTLVDWYRVTEKKSSLVAIPSVGSLQHCFWQS